MYCKAVAAGIESRLRNAGSGNIHVALGMSYGNPSIGSAIDELHAKGARRLLVLPLYPQYSGTTTGSVFDAVTAALVWPRPGIARKLSVADRTFVARRFEPDPGSWVETVLFKEIVQGKFGIEISVSGRRSARARAFAGHLGGAVLGVLNMIQKLLTEQEPECIAVVFDAKGKTFRDEIFEEYKANRPPMPDDLVQQLPWIHKVTEAFSIPVFEMQGYEADDLIGTLVEHGRRLGRPSTIVSRDKDLTQLLRKEDVFWDFAGKGKIGYDQVPDVFGVPPEQIADFLALAGDAVVAPVGVLLDVAGHRGDDAGDVAAVANDVTGIAIIVGEVVLVDDAVGHAVGVFDHQHASGREQRGQRSFLHVLGADHVARVGGLQAAGAGLAAILSLVVAVCGVWFAVALALGNGYTARYHRRRQEETMITEAST